jgi:hypothetical protein
MRPAAGATSPAVDREVASLRALAENTGGFCICAQGDETSGLRRIDRETARPSDAGIYVAQYLSGRALAATDRRVEVLVARPGAVVKILGVTER